MERKKEVIFERERREWESSDIEKKNRNQKELNKQINQKKTTTKKREEKDIYIYIFKYINARIYILKVFT